MISKLKNKYTNMPVQVKASLWFLVCSFLQKGISMITTPIFTRLLTTAEYGNYNVFNSWLSIITIFVTFNLSAGVYTQGLVKYEEERKVFSSSLQGLTLALAVVWTAVYIPLRGFWNNLFSLTTVQMLAMLVMIWTTAVFNFWSAEQRVQYKYKALVLVTLLVSIAKPVLGVVLVVNSEDKVTARILGLVIVEFAGYIALFFIQVIHGKKLFSGKFWKHALLFNLPLIPHYLSQIVLNSADRIMIKSMVSEDAAGIYSLAYSVSMIMTLFNTALMNTVSPWIYQKIKAKKNGDIAKVAYSSMAGIAVVNIILIAFGPEVVKIFAPASYYEAIWVIPPVAMSAFFMYSYDLFAKFAFYYEKTGFVMIASVFGAVLNIILNYIFIGLYGYIAAGYTTLACYIIYCVGHYIFMNKVCDKFCEGNRPYDLKKILMITLSFMAVGFIFLFTYDYIYVRYGLIAVIIVIGIIKRKTVIGFVKKFMALRK